MRKLILIMAACWPVASLGAAWSQSDMAEFADDTQLTFEVVSNTDKAGRKMLLKLDNQSRQALPAENWAVYFHAVRKVQSAPEADLRIEHIQGDLHRLVPTEEFSGLKSGEALAVEFSPNAHMVAYSDFMPRSFVVYEGLEPEVFANTDTEQLTEFVAPIVQEKQLRRSADDQYMIVTPQQRFVLAEGLVEAVREPRLIPAPSEIKYRRAEALLTKEWQIRYSGGARFEANYLQKRLKQDYGLELAAEPDHVAASGPVIYVLSGNSDTVEAKAPQGAEGYALQVEKKQIAVVGSDVAGAFYGIQSLLGLAKTEDGNVVVPRVSMQDSPRAGWRGMHYDMGRNFHGKEVTLRLIEQMARYKLNKLHLHLTEDEGWRLQIPGLPELTDVGANRCFDPSERECLLTQLGTGPHSSGSGNGYYSVDDFIEILKFATERHIEVIPEIDMPGHARAAIVSMNARYERLMEEGQPEQAERYLLSDPKDQSQYITVQNYTDNSVNVCRESTYNFVDKVIYELQQMYRKAGIKLDTFHMGGDEVGAGSWTASPICNQLFADTLGISGPSDLKPYFVSRVSAIANKRGLDLAGWEDGLMYDWTNTFNRSQFVNENVIANVWDNIWEWGVADRAHRLANAGYQVVLSHGTHLYFDHPHEVHPKERGYYWAARYTDLAKVFSYLPDDVYANADYTRNGDPIDNLEALVGRPLPPLEKPENILGIQGQVWTETIRTPEQLEQMIYPRLMALAERAWHKAAWEDSASVSARQRDYQGFVGALVNRELPRLQAQGGEFYLPPPGASIKAGKLHMNSLYPGVELEYSHNGTDWQSYQQPAEVGGGKIMLRARLGEQISRIDSLAVTP
ncbi:family 20 glycosylhydrolase [Gilvimarinus sp. SDUM040013]|uniref:beta-N-acetylhexosaminidase n=1 Tax=Gilvimarinus gilvus TaxID=3058038 RepID=A0ABU4RWF9_9GAMM|nr:family 20 glycosylhydrolase [Gilvimarinus sp. SDUM040013]MDO3385225.1 family 20 glycosylhydrolase [Gilvimarinus sp. SDUM040013]MDX6849208.1 family 20 glycosylhydrolase [Gilvimarinus sp. SDUM040013]